MHILELWYVSSAGDTLWLIICHIAYSMGQIIKPVCVFQCVCQSVYSSVGTLTVAFLDRLSPKLAQT